MSPSPFVPAERQRIHRVWWTCLPALPRSRSGQHYHALRRLWWDHTMNTYKELEPGLFRPGNRGFYTEGSEDHVTPAVFHSWALFPTSCWVPALLESVGVTAIGEVKRVRWSFAFEQIYEGRRFCIADIVLTWEDDGGQAVLVLEGKVRGRRLATKDIPTAAPYLRMPSIRVFSRRHYALIVDAADVPVAVAATNGAAKVTTWQQMAAIQLAACRGLPIAVRHRDDVMEALSSNHRHHGIATDADAPSIPEERPTAGTVDDYDRIRSFGLPECVEDFLVGASVVAAVRRGRMAAAPWEWMNAEPDGLAVYRQGKEGRPGTQSTPDRRQVLWSFNWTDALSACGRA